LGFAAIFALWLVSTYELAGRVTEAERRTTAIISRFTEGEERLFTVTAQVFLSSVYVRDAILDSGPDTMPFYRDQLRTTRVEVERRPTASAIAPQRDAISFRLCLSHPNKQLLQGKRIARHGASKQSVGRRRPALVRDQ
jgi:hypothetical protein